MTTRHNRPPWTTVAPGDRIEVLEMGDDPDPIPTGTRGTVTQLLGWPHEDGTKITQLAIDWDIDRSLALVYPSDRFRILTTTEMRHECWQRDQPVIFEKERERIAATKAFFP